MKYAIVESGGKQFKAVEGGTLEVDRLPVQPGEKVKMEKVLLLADGENITVGAPVVNDTPIWTKVIEHFKGEKVTIFNYSPKKRIRVKTGHRQNYTRLLVEQIGGSEFTEKEQALKAARTKKAAAPKAEDESTKNAPIAKVITKKPAAKKVEKATRVAEKPAKARTTKPAASVKKPAVKKPAAKK